MKPLQQRIVEFNQFYRLPCPAKPTTAAITAKQSLVDRIEGFLVTIEDEVEEGLQVRDTAAKLLPEHGEAPSTDHIDFLTDMADWLGDLVVYCYSEATKYGIPLDKVLDVIMDSNMSKVDAEGNCRYDENGKVIKNYEGCQYWKPEPKIRRLLVDAAYANQDTANSEQNHRGEEAAQQGE